MSCSSLVLGSWLSAKNPLFNYGVLAESPIRKTRLSISRLPNYSITNFLERETGIEPATNSLEGCDSTTELLPPIPAVSRQHSAFSPSTTLCPPQFSSLFHG